MADALGQFAFAVELFAAAHVVGALFNFLDDVLHVLGAAALVGCHSLVELLQAELNVVEVLDALAQRVGNVGQHGLEVAKGFTHNVGAFGAYATLRHGVGDEHHDAPVFIFVQVVVLAIGAGHKFQYAATDVGHAGSFLFATDMVGDGHDVVHQHVHVGEDGVVDVLQHIVGVVTVGHYLVSGVDEAVAERFHFYYVALDFELLGDVVQLVLFHDIVV